MFCEPVHIGKVGVNVNHEKQLILLQVEDEGSERAALSVKDAFQLISKLENCIKEVIEKKGMVLLCSQCVEELHIKPERHVEEMHWIIWGCQGCGQKRVLRYYSE